MKGSVKDYLKIFLGSLIIAAGIYYFWAPAQLAAGGISGLAIIVQYFLSKVPISLIILCLDTFMFTIGFIVLGKSFGIKSIISSLSIALATAIYEMSTPGIMPLSGDNLVILICGVICIALGQAIVFSQGASSGGTDIIAMIISKYAHLNIGVSLLIADMTVVLLAIGTFGMEKGLYAALGVLGTSIMIDYFITGTKVEKYVMIIPSNEDSCRQINDYILKDLERGATIYTAEGAYSKAPKKVITSVVGRKEFIQIKQFVQGIDENAFVTVQNLHEVLGEGFRKNI